jgi:hypothetical protein
LNVHVYFTDKVRGKSSLALGSHNYWNGGGRSSFVITQVKLGTERSISRETNLIHESGTQKHRSVSRFFVKVRHPVVFLIISE